MNPNAGRAGQGRVIDLNADVGEGGGQDEALFAAGITSANIACGAHAGDDATMAAACGAAVRHGVALGAHPGYADREFFGRREVVVGLAELEVSLAGQLGRLGRHAQAAGASLRHVKPHGALYHRLNREAEAARCFVAVVAGILPEAVIFGPPEGELRAAARAAGRRFAAEGFVDRAYRTDGSLVPRGEPGAVLHDGGAVVAQALALAGGGRVETLCVHGDGPSATRLLMAARGALVAAGFRIATVGA